MAPKAKIILGALLFLFFIVLHAKAHLADSTKASRKFIPTGVRVGVDVVPFARAEFSDSFVGFEALADVDIYRYYPTFEFGHWAREYTASLGSSYKNNGQFWRVGADINFLKKDPDKNIFSIGLRYGQSVYSEKALIVTTIPLWGDFTQTYENQSMSAAWVELTTGMRVKIWKLFWLGYTARFKFGLRKDDSRALLTTDVPGYGHVDKPTTWGFSYYAILRLPVRK